MIAWTDYPITELGDIPGQIAPIRQVIVLSYDGDKYCQITVFGVESPVDVKAGYLYTRRARAGEGHHLTRAALKELEK